MMVVVMMVVVVLALVVVLETVVISGTPAFAAPVSQLASNAFPVEAFTAI